MALAAAAARNAGGRIVFPSFVTDAELKLLDDTFQVEGSDVFVVSFPKSGTTWVNQIVHLLRTGGEQGSRVLSRAVPFLEGEHMAACSVVLVDRSTQALA